jgi:plastocyanin
MRAWAAATLLLTGLALLPATHARAAGSVVHVSMDNYSYTPPSPVIDPGTTVEWKVVAGDHTATSLGTEFDSDAMDTDSTPYRHTFNRPGRYDYRCQFHAEARGMRGVIEVRDPAGATTTTEVPTTTTTLPPYTTTTTGLPTTTTTQTSATTPTTAVTNTTAPPDPPGDLAPATTAPANLGTPSTTRPAPAKRSSSTTAPAARGRAGSAAPAATGTPVANPPAGTTATPPGSESSSTTSASSAAASSAPGVTLPDLAAQGRGGKVEAAAPAGEGQKGDRGDLHRVFALAGLAAMGGGGYGLRRWLPGRR